MGLTTKQLSRLSELLDQSLPLSRDERIAWLDSLSVEDAPLVASLRDSLLAEEPDSAALRGLAQLPALGAAAGGDPSATERRAGERLGAYELLQPLGAGGMAEVWLARRADGVFERQVALKIPRLAHLPAEMAERFARECKILATLECPGVARLYDAGIGADGTPYIAMEYVQGEPLVAWCDSRSLDARARVQLFLQVVEAVRNAHAQGIIHRDLKPSNIFVTGAGEVRLLDFGVASLLQVDEDSRSLTHVYGRALTPEYASPELLRGRPVDVRSDIYSLGAILHELIPVAETATEFTAGLRDVVKKAMAHDPVDRYPDAASFAAALQLAVAERPVSSAPRSRTRIFVMATIAVLAIAIGAVAIYRMRPAAPPDALAGTATATQGTATIAVLPFVDLSEGKDHAYLSDGLAEELIDLLAKIPELRVTARASSFAFRGQQLSMAEIGDRLNVANVLEGSVRTSGNRLKFTVQLVRARDGTLVWSETYDREMKDIFEIQENVAAAVVDSLKLRLLAANAVASDRRTPNVEAYTEYLLGKQYRDGFSLDRQEHAQAAFERAVKLDPAFAAAHAGIALAAADIGSMTMAAAPYELALAEAEKAMALNPRLVEAYVARAHVRMDQSWDYAGARSDLEFAATLEPNNLELMQLYATYWSHSGDSAKAIELQRLIIARDPVSSTAWDWLGVMLTGVRDYPGARKAYERAEQLSPYSDYRLLLRTLVEINAGNHEEGLRLARTIPDPTRRDYATAMAVFSVGPSKEGEEALARLIARCPDSCAAQITFIYAMRGDREQMFTWLDRAIATRDPGLKSMKRRPEFDKFKNDPQFQRTLQQLAGEG